MSDQEVVKRLVKELGDEDSEVRRRAARELSKIGDARAVEPLVATLGDENSRVSETASFALAKIGEPALAPLLAVLDDEDPMVRRRAALALGKIGDVRAVEPLVAALGEHIRVTEDAAAALGKIGEPALEPLLAVLDDENLEVVQGAALALGAIGDARAVEPLLATLGDWQVRRAAVGALAKIGATGAVEPPVAALAVEPLVAALDDGQYDVRTLAASALGELGDVRAVEPLLAAVADPDHAPLRRNAGEALKKIKARTPSDHVAASPPEDRLIEALLSPFLPEREHAIAVVEQGGDERSERLDSAYRASCKVKEAIASGGPTQQRLLEEAIELAPTFSAAMRLLSNIYQYERVSVTEALEWAKKAVAANPGDWLARIQLGRVYAHLKQDAVEATRAFAESVRLNPKVEGGIPSEPYSHLLPVYKKLNMEVQATDAEKRVGDGETGLAENYKRTWLALVAAAPVEGLRDALKTDKASAEPMPGDRDVGKRPLAPTRAPTRESWWQRRRQRRLEKRGSKWLP
jgi:HEAT repeat protein